MAPGGREKYRNSYLDGSWDGRQEGVANSVGRPGHLWCWGTPKLSSPGPCHGPKQTHPTDGPLLEVRAPAGWEPGWQEGGGSQHCRATWASMGSGNAQAPLRRDPATARSLVFIFLNYESFHFCPSTQHPPIPPSSSLYIPKSSQDFQPCGKFKFLPPPSRSWKVSIRTEWIPKIQYMQKKQVPVSLSEAFQKGSRPATFRESGHIQKIWLDHILVQSQSNWPW